MAAFDFPSSPNNGDTYSANGIDWIYNGTVWKKDATAGVKGQKGEVGQKGQKGEVGEKGVKGEVGDKGQKGEIGATGGTGGTGQKGQKGEDGNDATGTKGQKGEIGSTGGTGGTGDKGEPGAGGSNGSDGDKGQKGASGTDASLPSGVVVLWSGAANAIPSGWYLCNGSNGTPDLRDRFVVGAGSGYSVGNTGGAASVTLSTAQMPSHNHSVNDPTHGHSVNDPGHFHTTNDYVARSGYAEPRNFGVGTDGNANSSGNTNSKTTGLVVNAGGTGISINNAGSGSAHENRPPYYALCYIMKS